MSPAVFALAVLLSLVGCSGAHPQTSSSSPTGPIVFIVLGQSNAQGRGTTAYAPNIPDGEFLRFYDRTIQPLADPTHVGASGYPDPVGSQPSYSSWPRFAELVIAGVPDHKFVILPCARTIVGAATSLDWATGVTDPATTDETPPTPRVKAQIDALLDIYPDATIGAIIVYHGEADAFSGSSALSDNYAAHWASVYDELERYLGARNTAFAKSLQEIHVRLPATPAPGLRSGRMYKRNKTRSRQLAARR